MSDVGGPIAGFLGALSREDGRIEPDFGCLLAYLSDVRSHLIAAKRTLGIGKREHGICVAPRRPAKRVVDRHGHLTAPPSSFKDEQHLHRESPGASGYPLHHPDNRDGPSSIGWCGSRIACCRTARLGRAVIARAPSYSRGKGCVSRHQNDVRRGLQGVLPPTYSPRGDTTA